MRRFFLLIPLSLALLVSCKKEKVVYTTELNLAITSQSLALLGIYDVVNIHMNMVQGADYTGCFNQSRDTVAGIVYDTSTVAADGSCSMVHADHTSGRFSAIYPSTASTTTGESIVLTFNNFYTNGVTFSGTLSYVWIAEDSVRITTQNLVMTDQAGSTTVTADLSMNWNTGLGLTGSLSGSGANNYSWTIQQALSGGDQLSEIHTGLAVFKAYDEELFENFGNGEEDDFAIFEDVFEERKVLNLPTL